MSRKRTNIEEFDPARVRPLPGQPRKRFRGIKELAASIGEIGQRQAGIVTLMSDDARFDAQLVDGERRLRACKMAGVPFRAEICDAAGAEEIFVASFAANFGKQDHDVIEIAEGLARMQRAGKSIEQMARIAGKSEGWVYQHLSLLKLHPSVQGMMVAPDEQAGDAGGAQNGDGDRPKLNYQLAQLLIPLDHQQQIDLAHKVVTAHCGEGMGLPEARRVILKARAKAGDPDAYLGGRRRGKQRQIQSIESILEDVTHRIAVYTDMPGPQIAALIDAITDRSKARLVDRVKEMQELLGALVELIEDRMMKKGRAA